MRKIENTFKKALTKGRSSLGLWASFADPYAAEALASVGADWMLIDGEHAPNDVRSILAQLQAVAPYDTHPVVRTPDANPTTIKQMLDIGAQTLMVPMIDTAQQARAVVSAAYYPPYGTRGMGASLGRASRWNTVADYTTVAGQETCVIVQVETVTGLRQVREIAAVEGVDGVFFGPVDLSASMGLINQPTHPDVVSAIMHGTQIVREAGKAAGVLCLQPDKAQEYLNAGVQFVAVGVDILLMANAARAALAPFAPKSST